MEFEKSRIERLKRDLYSRDIGRVPVEKRGDIHTQEIQEKNVPKDWGTDSHVFDIPTEARVVKDKSRFFSSFFGISLIFFAIAIGVAVFIFMGGLNMISSKNVDIKITGPSSISSGEELDANVSVINQNHADLLNATLYIDYPSGTQSVGVTSVPLTHDVASLNTIPSGKTSDYSLRSVFFGETNTVKSVTFRLEYSVKGSDAVFSKTKTYDISIGSSPIILHVAYPPTINSGQPVTLSIDLTSNSNTLLPNTLVKVTYPYGFTYTSSNIKIQNNTALAGTWNIGDLQNGDKKTLTVNGVLVGQDSEERSFQVTVGTESNDPSKDFDTELAASTATISLNKSFYDLTALGSNNSSNAVTTVGNSIPVRINWQNTLTDNLVDNHIEAVVTGNVFDRSSVHTDNQGFYRSLDNTVIWDKTTTDKLAQLSPGDTGQVSFTFNSLQDQSFVRTIKNPHINVAVSMSGTRISANDSTTISSTANLIIRLQSMLSIVSRSFRTFGPFTNTGSVPPIREAQSTYTVVWTLTNTTNDVDGTTVSATLPQNVTWLNQVSPASEHLLYNKDTRKVTWNVGLVPYSTGYSYPPKTIYFQLGLTPSVTDVGSPLVLVSEAGASGTDTYASTTISAYSSSVSTHYSDNNFVAGDDLVK